MAPKEDRLVGGDVNFDEVYVRHVSFVARCLRLFGVPACDLDDAAQDVFVWVHRYLLRGGKRVERVRPWLYVIARWVAMSHRRRARRKQAPLDPLVAEPPDPDPGPLERAASAEAAGFVETFLAALDDRKRELFILSLEGMTTPEIADSLSITLDAAGGRRLRLRAEFRRALAGRELGHAAPEGMRRGDRRPDGDLRRLPEGNRRAPAPGETGRKKPNSADGRQTP